MSGRVGWVDATHGISGDMLLGACVDAGVELAVIQAAIDRLGLPEPVVVTRVPVRRGALGATQAVVSKGSSVQRRTLVDVLALLDRSDPDVGAPAAGVFRRLAEAEARVHQVGVEEVHFHEVGALDSIADVVGVVAGLQALGVDRLVCSPIALGGGRAMTEHGPIPVPGPAVAELLRASSAPAFGGPVEIELATPTGVALMVTLADEFGPMPSMRPDLVGTGAGTSDPAGHPNITRLVVGEALATTLDANGLEPALAPAVVVEANVDDLDPRLWPQVLAELLAAGASDAWLTPILMKKGRPAHTLSVLAPPEYAERLEQVVFAQTSTIGLRRHPVDKRALPRESVVVRVDDHEVRVKVARLNGRIVNAVPEYDDVARIAAERGVPATVVLDAARAAAQALLQQ
jgi:pyridinium-3,5-bisthiocarboxylic acid mononucleotide nickel chelatase